MMARTALLPLGLAAAATLLTPAPARAQCRLCEKPTTAPEQQGADAPARLEVEANLDFDRLILSAPGEGSATLMPDGSTQLSGTIAAISGRAMVGQVRVRGEPGRLVRIDLPGRIELNSISGGRVTIDEIATDLPPMPRLDSSGSLSFRFGGRLRTSGDADGQYSGEVPITVEYL